MRETLIELFIEVSKRLSQKPDGCQNLVYVRLKGNGRTISEPEARFILASVLHETNIPFGLEVPTEEDYSFTGNAPRKGRIDVVIDPSGKAVKIELKAERLDVDKIGRDFKKLLREPASGCAFYHVFQGTTRSPLHGLMKKYVDSYPKREDVGERVPKWFILFVLDRKRCRCLWKVFDNIGELTEQSFEHGSFETEDL